MTLKFRILVTAGQVDAAFAWLVSSVHVSAQKFTSDCVVLCNYRLPLIHPKHHGRLADFLQARGHAQRAVRLKDVPTSRKVVLSFPLSSLRKILFEMLLNRLAMSRLRYA